MDDSHDRELETRLCEGDDSAFWALMDQHHRVIDLVLFGIDYFRRRPLEREEAAMAVADRAHRKRHQFRGKGRFRAWLAILTRNEALNRVPKLGRDSHRRHNIPTVSINSGPDGDSVPIAVHGAQESNLLQREVDEALDGLDERDRQCVTLFFLGGLTDKEIAEAIGEADPRLIAPIRHRAIAKLRESLDVRGVR
ncbi:MAG: sigma-70 family RNA polymerase sigma factor [Acidobacteriia bacterium]|nr:sigma-70 family RNA polymerase sigma factor [Terriglobia bacterium]